MATLKLTLGDRIRNRLGLNLTCMIGVHPFNRRRICKLCKFVENKVAPSK